MTRILVAEDSRTQAQEILFLLEDAGFEAELVADGREALEALRRSPPDLVLTDLDMPHMNGLELVEAVRADYPAVPVILMTALGSEEIAVQALQKGAASYVPKRSLVKDIVSTLDNVLAVAQAGRQQRQLLDCLARTESCYVLDNNTALVAPLIGHLEDTLTRLRSGDRTDLMRVGIALQEALTNAINHGNLEVSSELRQKDEEEFHALANQRRGQAPYRDRRVRVTAAFSRSEAIYTIEDEGPGFDPSTLPDPTDPASLGRVGGRGLLLIRTFMDEVRHNATGNRILMRKQFPSGGRMKDEG